MKVNAKKLYTQVESNKLPSLPP